MTTNDWSIHDGTALRAVLPLTITRAGRDPYGRTFVCGDGWRLDLLCDWTLRVLERSLTPWATQT